MSAVTSAGKDLGGRSLYERVKEFLDELEELRPFFDMLREEDRLLAELILARKDAILEEAARLDREGVVVPWP